MPNCTKEDVQFPRKETRALLVAHLLHSLPIRKTKVGCYFFPIRMIIIKSASNLLLVWSLSFFCRQAASRVHQWRVEKATFDTPSRGEADELINSHIQRTKVDCYISISHLLLFHMPSRREAELVISHLPTPVSFLARGSSSGVHRGVCVDILTLDMPLARRWHQEMIGKK